MTEAVSADEVGIKALDDTTLEFDLKAPCPYFVDRGKHVGIRSRYRKQPSKQTVTNGPNQQIPTSATARSRSRR